MALSFFALAAEIPVILPPNTTAYTATEVSVLTAGIATLREVLSDYAYGSYQYFDPTDWMSFDFAAYTAGILAGMGYETRLVKGEGWVDGEHTWVIVGIPLAGQVAWVPVEASPGLGKRQSILGTIPSFTDGAGAMWFESGYTSFAAEVTLPANMPPIAAIRVVPSLGIVGQEVTFLGVTSRDPDGQIIRYKWDLGGLSTSEAVTVRHIFTAAGTYTISLTVTDSRGAKTTTSISYRVKEPKDPTPASGGGCGCGG
jgi:YD repeat-containing protein